MCIVLLMFGLVNSHLNARDISNLMSSSQSTVIKINSRYCVSSLRNPNLFTRLYFESSMWFQLLIKVSIAAIQARFSFMRKLSLFLSIHSTCRLTRRCVYRPSVFLTEKLRLMEIVTDIKIAKIFMMRSDVLSCFTIVVIRNIYHHHKSLVYGNFSPLSSRSQSKIEDRAFTQLDLLPRKFRENNSNSQQVNNFERKLWRYTFPRVMYEVLSASSLDFVASIIS